MKEFNIDYAQKTSTTVGNGYSVSVNILAGNRMLNDWRRESGGIFK